MRIDIMSDLASAVQKTYMNKVELIMEDIRGAIESYNGQKQFSPWDISVNISNYDIDYDAGEDMEIGTVIGKHLRNANVSDWELDTDQILIML